MGRAAVGQGEQDAEQPAAGRQLAAAYACRQHRLDQRCHPRGVDQLLQPAEVGLQGRRPPSQATASSSLALGRAATMSPRRWQQLTPAAAMNAGSPMAAATSASQVARNRATSKRGKSSPPVSEPTTGVVTLRRQGLEPPASKPSPATSAQHSNREW